jgi:hypothetical protein
MKKLYTFYEKNCNAIKNTLPFKVTRTNQNVGDTTHKEYMPMPKPNQYQK